MSETRKLGEQERLLNYLHRFGGLIALQVLHIGGTLDEALLRDALAWLQQQHPILRAHIRYGKLVFIPKIPFIYRQPWFDTDGTTPIPLAIINDANPEAWREVMAKDLRTPIAAGKHPRLRVTLVRQSPEAQQSHIVITADHATLDAQSGNMISRQLMQFLADPEKARAQKPIHATLPPPLEERLPKKPDSGTKGYEPAIRIPPQQIEDQVEQTRVISVHLDQATTDRIKAAAKANKTTLHGAVTAAFLLGYRERYRSPEMTLLTTIDLRRLCRPPLPAETYGCYIDILRTRHQLSDDFWAIARDVSFKLITTLAKDQESASMLKLPGLDVYRIETQPIMKSNRRIDGLAVTVAGESGLERTYGRFTLDDVTMAVSLDMFGPSLFVIASERLGGLDLSVGYTAFAMSDADARSFTKRAEELLNAA